MIDPAIGARLIQAREALNLTQKGMFQTSGVPVSTLKKYEGSHREPGAAHLSRLARAGINVNWLLTGDGNMLLMLDPAPAGESASMGAPELYPCGVPPGPLLASSAVPYRTGLVDSLLLEQVIAVFIEYIDANRDRVRIDRSRHAAVIAVLYKIAAATGKADKSELEQVLRAAA